MGACVYTEPGVLMAFLRLLSEHKVNYEMVYAHTDLSTISFIFAHTCSRGAFVLQYVAAS